MIDDGFEFGIGVDAETDFTNHDVAVGLGVERLHREVESVGDTVHKVNKKVAAVNGSYPQCNGIERFVCIEIDRNHIIAV